MSEESKKGRMRGEGTRRTRGMPAQQVFWGILMLLSLFVMFAVGIPSVGMGENGKKDSAPPYAASDIQDSSVGGENAAAGGSGTEFAAVSGQETEGLGAEQKGINDLEAEAGVQTAPEGEVEKAQPGDGMPEEEAKKTPPEDGMPEEEATKAQPGDGMPEGEAEKTPPEDENPPIIAMTFDDGPFTKVTNRIVDVLLEYNAGATFFVVGSRIDMYSDTLKRVYESGFEVASHAWSHKNLNGLSQEEVLKELNDTQDKLNTYIPVGDVLLRPPYGNANETVRELAGTPLINWSLDSEDWKSKDADTIIQHVLSTVKDGDIILMHDLYESTAQAVEYLVPELVARGYRIVSVSELFRCKGIPLEEGILYRNPWDYY